MLYNGDGPCHLVLLLLSSASLHLRPSLSLFPWPVKIHTATQPCGKSDKTSVELHLLGGMYVANDFQGLMMRKEVENWGEEREGWRRGGGAEEKKKKSLEQREQETVLNVLTAVEVIN